MVLIKCLDIIVFKFEVNIFCSISKKVSSLPHDRSPGLTKSRAACCYSPGLLSILRTSPTCISSCEIKRRAYSSSKTLLPSTNSNKWWYADNEVNSCCSDSRKMSPISCLCVSSNDPIPNEGW